MRMEWGGRVGDCPERKAKMNRVIAVGALSLALILAACGGFRVIQSRRHLATAGIVAPLRR
jgi:type IV secretory pathway TrbF-like protein